MNIVTSPAKAHKGGSFKIEVGSDSFRKGTLVANTEMILDDSFALTLGIVAKAGDGFGEGLWTEGWAYYLGATWRVNEKHTLEFNALGAPQQHGHLPARDQQRPLRG